MDQQTTKRFTHTRKSRVARCCNDRHGALVHFIASEFRRPGHGCGSLSHMSGERRLAGWAGPDIAGTLQRFTVAGRWQVPSRRPQKQLNAVGSPPALLSGRNHGLYYFQGHIL